MTFLRDMAMAPLDRQTVTIMGSISGVILRNPLFHLTHQVSSNISSFGINATANTHKQSQQCTAEAKAY
jgi:hypothetical protein